jgi:hypothetical protein
MPAQAACEDPGGVGGQLVDEHGRPVGEVEQLGAHGCADLADLGYAAALAVELVEAFGGAKPAGGGEVGAGWWPAGAGGGSDWDAGDRLRVDGLGDGAECVPECPEGGDRCEDMRVGHWASTGLVRAFDAGTGAAANRSS